MTSRLLVAVALATVACSSRKKPAEDPPVPGGSASATDAAAPVTPDAAPEVNEENVYVAQIATLTAALGLDGVAAPAQVDPAATTRFATVTRRHDPARRALVQAVHVYRIADGKLALESEAELPQTDHNLISWVWRDARELVLLYGDGTMLRVAGSKVSPIARPAKKLFEVEEHDNVMRLERDLDVLATTNGDVWLHHCVWGPETGPCARPVFVRVVGGAKASATPPPPRPAPAPLPPLPDWSLALAQPDSSPGALACKGPGIAATIPVPDGTTGFSAGDDELVSREPPIRIIFAWEKHGDAISPSPRLLAGCTLIDPYLPIVERGPNAFWAVGPSRSSEGPEGTALVAWHGRIITTLPEVQHLLFAPD